jgi:Tfp pilus assembly protein PilE
VTLNRGQGGAITPVEAFVLAVMAAILIAIVVPSYVTMQNRSSDASARAQLQDAADALDARLEERGTAEPGTRCLEKTVGGRTWRLTFPERSLQRGSCP